MVGKKEVLKYKDEKQLIDNWATILFENNRDIDRLNDCPLTEGEKKQLMQMVKSKGSPFLLNKLVNGRTLSIQRDNEKDKLHYGKTVSLSIYDRNQIAGGKSRYQIAQQPLFIPESEMDRKRRGDLTLLINGMPVIHIELKKSGIPVNQAVNQIRKYRDEGKFEGLFSLIQVFVAMTPEDHLYFANPGLSEFNPKFFYRWADAENKICADWKEVVQNLLFIPMAHKLVGFYTVPDKSDKKLKVLRSYQIFAVEKISSALDVAHWTRAERRGGYVFHTTGSGKTLTSFKAASLVASDGKVDKSLFLADRKELGFQTLNEYQNFASGMIAVQDTEDTVELYTKLKSNNIEDKLIVTSIQKMALLSNDYGHNPEFSTISSKRIAIIVDECHRSTFGKMLRDIEDALPVAKYFGFSGTPIYDENNKDGGTTSDLFGEELCKYTITDGLRDGNVLAFDLRMEAFDEKSTRVAVALNECKAKSELEALSDPEKKRVFLKWTDRAQTTMVEVEKKIPKTQYEEPKYYESVVDNVLKDWISISFANKFHAIFAASSIPEAIDYYRLFKKNAPQLKITALFDEHDGNEQFSPTKVKAIKEILEDYNDTFVKSFRPEKYELFKKDVNMRLAHKEDYEGIDNNPEKQLDLVIVVDMLLTGFDSKWVNALYLDKMLENEHIVQAFSRTNRVLDDDKQFGVIKYYRYPYTMEKRIEKAFKLYSGERASEMFVSKLPERLESINNYYKMIKSLFDSENITYFERLPKSEQSKISFSKLFPELRRSVHSAFVQDFRWDKKDRKYVFENGKIIIVDLTEEIYKILETRYKELFPRTRGPNPPIPPYDLDTSLTEYSTERVDFKYMNSRFEIYRKAIQSDTDPETVEEFLAELSRSFASLSETDQGFATKIVSDLSSGQLYVSDDETFQELLIRYKNKKLTDEIKRISESIGIDESQLRLIMLSNPTEQNLNEYNRFDKMVDGIDLVKAKTFLEDKIKSSIPPHKVKSKARTYLREYILNGGFDA
ncbi:type I site-specific deoxyribonuclease, HsdR family [Thermoplasmatales archaeon BRNA1]|nr:type I site-specific deoxyribonuclease, HsdR family [Thermoplasmatales archaeon BRNA1]